MTPLRPMSEAPKAGEILVNTRDRAGCNGWLIVHYADGGGEEQPRFRGWFFWTGYDFREANADAFIGWAPLPPNVDNTRDIATATMRAALGEVARQTGEGSHIVEGNGAGERELEHQLRLRGLAPRPFVALEAGHEHKTYLLDHANGGVICHCGARRGFDAKAWTEDDDPTGHPVELLKRRPKRGR